MLKNRWLAIAAAGLISLAAVPAMSFAKPAKHAVVAHKTVTTHVAPKPVAKKVVKKGNKNVAKKHGKKSSVKHATRKPVKKASHKKHLTKHTVSHAKKA